MSEVGPGPQAPSRTATASELAGVIDTSDPTFVLTEDGLYLFANEAMASAWGTTAAAIIGKRIDQFFDKAEASKRMASVAEVFRTGLPSTFEGVVSTLRGKQRYETKLRPPRDASGTMTSVAGTSRDVTTQLETEEKLRVSEAMLKGILDALPDAILLKDREGRCLFANAAFAKATGRTRDELWMRPSDAIFDGHAEVGRLGEVDQRVVATDHAEVHEEIVAYPDGEHTVLVTKGPMRSAAGTVIGVVASGRDVTTSKATERALRESEERYRSLARDLQIGMVVHGPNGDIVFSNPKALELLGLSENQLWGRTAFDPEWNIVHEDGAAFPAETLPAVVAIRTQRAVSGVIMGVHRPSHDDRVWLLVDAHPSPSSDREQREVVVTFTDITALRRAEAALHERTAMLVSVMDGVRDAIVFKDVPGRWLFANEAAAVAIGHTKDSVIGKTFFELHPDQELAARITVQDRRVVATGIPETGEDDVETRAGRRRYAFTKSPVRSADGQIIGVVGMSKDVTDQRQLEERAMTRERLASLGLLAAGVGHEVNTPLAYALYNLETIAEAVGQLSTSTPPSPEVASDLQACTRDALDGLKRIKEITRRLGAFARVETTSLVAVDLNGALETALAMVNNEIRYRAKIVTELGAIPPVAASAGQLSQVFVNLLLNASAAFENRPFDASCVTLRSSTAGDTVIVEIEDNGQGIAPDHLPRVFDPFFTTKPVGMGSGLGLSVCRSIVSELGGSIEVESELGRGTRVSLRLPARIAAAASPTPAPAAVTTPVRGRILVIDDEPSLTKIMRRILGGAHDVVTAASGGEARSLLEADRAFDIVLCDLMMPGMTGMDLHAWLSGVDPALASRLVFMSGGAFLPSAADYVASTGNLRIDKPIETTALKRLVNELVLAARRPS